MSECEVCGEQNGDKYLKSCCQGAAEASARGWKRDCADAREELRKARLRLKGCMGHFHDDTPVSKIAEDVAAEFHRGRLREQEQREKIDALLSEAAAAGKLRDRERQWASLSTCHCQGGFRCTRCKLLDEARADAALEGT